MRCFVGPAFTMSLMPVNLNGRGPNIFRKIFETQQGVGGETYDNNNDDDDVDNNNNGRDPRVKRQTVISNTSDWVIHDHVIVRNRLGAGSSGIAFQAFYNTGIMIEKCVVKLPLELLKKGLLQVDNDGGLHLSASLDKRVVNARYGGGGGGDSHAKKIQSSAVDNFVGEWKNSFTIHFGKHMATLGMDRYRWDIAAPMLSQIKRERTDLIHRRGYENIHRLLLFDETVPLIISEHFDGTLEDLAKILERSSTAMKDDFMFDCIIPQTYAGLLYMHSEEIDMAHMDIKPMNMLYRFAPGKKYPHVVLCDFGLSQPASKTIDMPMGSPAFMAPEMSDGGDYYGCPPYTPKYTDVHSWALSMFLCFHPHSIQAPLLQTLLTAEQMMSPPRTFSTIQRQRTWEKLMAILQEEGALNPEQRYSIFLNIDAAPAMYKTTNIDLLGLARY